MPSATLEPPHPSLAPWHAAVATNHTTPITIGTATYTRFRFTAGLFRNPGIGRPRTRSRLAHTGPALNTSINPTPHVAIAPPHFHGKAAGSASTVSFNAPSAFFLTSPS